MAAASAYDYLFKVIVIGDDSTGKSALLSRFTDDQFTESYIATIGVDFKIKNIDVEGKLIKAQIWDTAGQERFRSITSRPYKYYRSFKRTVWILMNLCGRAGLSGSMLVANALCTFPRGAAHFYYYRGCHGAIIVFDVTDTSSFKHVEHWVTDLEHYVDRSLPKVLVGNKCDLNEKRCVTSEEARSLAVINNLDYVEASAKTNDGVYSAFETLLKEIYKKSEKAPKVVAEQRAPTIDHSKTLSLGMACDTLEAFEGDIKKSRKHTESKAIERIVVASEAESESETTFTDRNKPKWAEELSRNVQKLTKRMKTIDKLEATIKTMSKRMEDLENKMSKIDSRQSKAVSKEYDVTTSSEKSSVCLIL